MKVIRLLCVGLAYLAVSASGAESWNHPLREKFPGLQHGTLQSASMKVEVGYNIFLPPDYATNTSARYPVIYYLHGMDGHESSYPDYARLLAEAIRTRTVPPVILVLVNGGGTSFSPTHRTAP
jgi:endo-1,4-beta-xylanase